MPRRLLPFAIAFVASALLGAPAAQATVRDDVGKVTSDVEAVTGAAIDALPSPPVPIETPVVPKVPASPPPHPAPKPPPAATDAAETAVHDLGGSAGKAAGEAARAPSETAGSGASAGPDPGGGVTHPAARRPDRRSVGPAEAAPLLRWRAYVWPAIALEIRDALAPLLVRLEGVASVRLPDVFGPISSPAVPVSEKPDPGGSDVPAARADQPSQPPWSPGIALPRGGMGLLVALAVGFLMVACFVALARLVVGEELFEGRYWRGHRG